MTPRSEQSWNRRCALEFVGHIFSGLGSLRHTDDMEAAFSWAMAALDPEQPDAAPEPPADDLAAFGESVGTTPSEEHLNRMRAASEELNAARQRWLARHPEGAGGPVALSRDPEVKREQFRQAYTPPRTVPVEGDGSMEPPIFRFYAVHDEPPSTGYLLWREDTRNLFGNHRWSSWDSRNERWLSTASSDGEADLDRQEAPEHWSRITAEKLQAVYHVQVETRNDTEE